MSQDVDAICPNLVRRWLPWYMLTRGEDNLLLGVHGLVSVAHPWCFTRGVMTCQQRYARDFILPTRCLHSPCIFVSVAVNLDIRPDHDTARTWSPGTDWALTSL
jgi:hypothetical protein